jgi:hypothetical protein
MANNPFAQFVQKANPFAQFVASAPSATPSDIPGNYQPPEQTGARGFLDYAAGIPEAALTTITGGLGIPISAAAGILTGKLGQGPNKQIQEQIMKAVTYQPQSETGREILGGVGNALSGIPSYLGTMGAFRPGPAINALRNETQMARGFQLFPDKTAQLITQSYENANLIDAANAAKRLGVSINPAVSNPTKTNKLIGTLAGSPEPKMARTNEPQWTREAKRDMGLPPNTTLNEQAFDQALKDPLIVKPYETVRNLGLVTADEGIIKEIEGLKTQSLIGGEASQMAVSKLADQTIARLNAGMSGQNILNNVQNLRQSAQRIYRAEEKGVTAPSKESMAVADASMALADQLENAASLYLTGTEARSFKNARTLAAKVFDYQRATNLRTGQLDPIKFAKITEGKPLTGTASDIAMVAANFPSIAEVKPASWVSSVPTLLRGGTGGTIGYGIGSAFGMGPVGAVIGTTGGAVTNALMAKRMSSPAYQAANAIPVDYRAPVNMMRPVEPGSSNLALFNPENAVVGAEYKPNFIFQEPPPPPRSVYEAAQRAQMEAGQQRVNQTRPDLQPANLPPQLPMPGAEGPAQARTYEYARDRAAAEAAAAAGAGPRQSAGAGIGYELDPFTGKLRPVGEQVKGPETFAALQENAMMRDLQYVEQLKAELESLKGSKNRVKANDIKKQIQEIEFFYADKTPNFLVKRGRNENYGSSENFTGPSGLRNITPQSGSSIISSRQTALESAIEKVKRGELVTLTAEEKIALRDLQKQNKLAP